MLRRSCLALSAALVLAAWTIAEEYKGVTIIKADKFKATLKVDDKEVLIVWNPKTKAYDADGKELKGSDAPRILKEDNQVDVTTIKGRSKVEVIKEIHLVKGELADAGKGSKPAPSAAPAPANTPATTNVYKDATVGKVARGKVTITVDGKDVELSFGASFKAFDQNDKELPFGESLGIFKAGNTVEVTALKRGNSETLTQIKLIKGEIQKIEIKLPK
jgi:hypothetical protein